MEQMRPTAAAAAVFPFYAAAQLHHNLAASMSTEGFRFPSQPPFQYQTAAMFPATLHPLAAHHHPHPHSHPHRHPAHPHPALPHPALSSQAAVAAAAAAFHQGRGGVLPATPQPAHTHHHHHQHQQHHPRAQTPQVMPVIPLLAQQPLGICQEELDMVLYGYAKGAGGGNSSSSGGSEIGQYHSGHALSGLNLSHMVTAEAAAVAAAAVAAAAAAASTTSGGGGGGGGGGAGVGVASSSSMSSPASSSAQGGRQSVDQPESVTFGIDKILSATQASPGSASSTSTKTSQAVLDTSSLELPEGIAIVQTTLAGTVHYGVFCTKTVIARGSRFGPFKGRIVHTSEIKTHDDNSCMWEIFQDGKLSHFIDGRGSACNWMSHVKCARYAQEQNLIAVQADGAIWYEACKDIPQGTELLVWYGDCYLQFMGVPVALKEMADGGAQEEADTSEGFQCERCGKVFAYKYYRDKHLKYTRCVDQGDRKYPCTLCTRSFEKRDRLRIHILHVHEKHRPHKCMVCGKSFSQSSSLNKHMRVHSGERPYKCVYCNKAFTASSILRTHIRQHSGEKPFKCKHCGKAFASHAAHDSHVRRTHAKERPCTCSVCGKTFSQSFELKLHMNSHMAQ